MRLSPDGRTGRGRYLGAGLALFALKVLIDYGVARAFSHPYTVLFYLNRMESPLLRPSENPVYWLVMWAVALPFIAIGLILTIRRLRDAGLSPWLALLFFAPFANILFFAFCSLVPGREGRGGSPVASAESGTSMPYSRAVVGAAVLGAAVGIAALGLGVFGLNSYGAAVILGAPIASGVVTGFKFSRWYRPEVSGALLAALLSILLVGMIVIVFALEGLICLAMAFPIVIVSAMLGAMVGCLMARSHRIGGYGPAALAVFVLPASLVVESLHPLPLPDPQVVMSSTIVNAPPDVVWDRLISFPALPPPDELIFRAGIAAPVGAVIDGEGKGAVRRCLFTTGSFVEPIEVWDPPRELTFAVASEPDPMRELTLWRGPRPPHLDGFLETTRGQFVLEALPGGRTRLVGRTWYRTHMVPEPYWRLWADGIIHTIHMRVLRHVARLSERDRG